MRTLPRNIQVEMNQNKYFEKQMQEKTHVLQRQIKEVLTISKKPANMDHVWIKFPKEFSL